MHPRALLDKPTPEVSTVEAIGRGTQVVRERSAKPLFVSSILTRASSGSLHLADSTVLFEFDSLPRVGPSTDVQSDPNAT